MAIPTKHKITYACGHTKTEDLKTRFPDKPVTKLNKGFADFLSEKNQENERVCGPCFKESRKVDENQWMLDIADFEQKYQLPDLEGSEKQHEKGVVDSARKDRHSVLQELFENPSDDAKSQHATLLEASRELTRVNFWTDNLGFKIRKDNDYGQDEYITLILDGLREKQEREAAGDDDRIETENPHDWDGQE